MPCEDFVIEAKRFSCSLQLKPSEEPYVLPKQHIEMCCWLCMEPVIDDASKCTTVQGVHHTCLMKWRMQEKKICLCPECKPVKIPQKKLTLYGMFARPPRPPKPVIAIDYYWRNTLVKSGSLPDNPEPEDLTRKLRKHLSACNTFEYEMMCDGRLVEDVIQFLDAARTRRGRTFYIAVRGYKS